jgi:hypothetical protein
MKNPMPEDMRFTYEVFCRTVTEGGFAFAGMLMRADPPCIFAIGNVKEKGHSLAALFRQYADIMDEKTTEGRVEFPEQENNG